MISKEQALQILNAAGEKTDGVRYDEYENVFLPDRIIFPCEHTKAVDAESGKIVNFCLPPPA